MAEWAKSVGAHKSATFEGVEILRNMPPSWRVAFEDVE
jgi:hypothetical protein